MKHLLLILLFFSLFLSLTSCENDDPSPSTQTAAESIKGTWDAQTRKIEYFNGSGTKLFESIEDFGPGKFTFDGVKMTIYTSSGAVQETQFYKLSASSGKSTLSISRDGTVFNDMELTRLTQSNMTWVIEKTHPNNVTYTENGIDKLAQKTKQTYELTR